MRIIRYGTLCKVVSSQLAVYMLSLLTFSFVYLYVHLYVYIYVDIIYTNYEHHNITRRFQSTLADSGARGWPYFYISWQFLNSVILLRRWVIQGNCYLSLSNGKNYHFKNVFKDFIGFHFFFACLLWTQ